MLASWDSKQADTRGSRPRRAWVQVVPDGPWPCPGLSLAVRTLWRRDPRLESCGLGPWCSSPMLPQRAVLQMASIVMRR